MIQDNESNLMEDSKVQFPITELSEFVDNKSYMMSESINCSFIKHQDSMNTSLLSKLNADGMSQPLLKQLKDKYAKVKNKCERLTSENNLLKSKCQKNERDRIGRMSSSIKSCSKSKTFMESTKRDMVRLNKHCDMIESVYHPASIQALDDKFTDDKFVFILKDIKTTELNLERVKLGQMFNNIKSDLSCFKEWITKILGDREVMIQMVSDFLNEYLNKVKDLSENFMFYQFRVDQLIQEFKTTFDAMDSYCKNSSQIIDYYKAKDRRHSLQKFSTKTHSNNKSSYKSGKISQMDSTSEFKYIIAKTFINFPEVETEDEIQSVLSQQLEEIQELCRNNCQQVSFSYKKKLEQYIRSIFQLKQLINNQPQQQTYLDNATVRLWMKNIKNKIKDFKQCKSFLCDIYKAQQDEDTLEHCYKQNIQQLTEQISFNKDSLIKKIYELSSDSSDHIQFFVTTSYSNFTKILLTNFIKINEFNLSDCQSGKWRRIAMNSIKSFKKVIQEINKQLYPDGNSFVTNLMREQQEFILRMLKSIEYTNDIVTNIKKLI